MEDLESGNKQLTEVFDVKKQSINKIDWKELEDLQEKFVVQFTEDCGSMPSILENYWVSKDRNNWRKVCYSGETLIYFPFFMEQIKKIDWNWCYTYNNNYIEINSKKLYLLKIEQAFTKDWDYYFYTSDWQILTVDKNDFNTNGLKAKSLKFFNQWRGDCLWRTDKILYINQLKAETKWDWFVRFFENWKLKIDIPWDNIFQIEPSSFLISDWWKMYQYRFFDTSSYKKLDTFDMDYKWVSQMVVDYNGNFLFIINETDEWPTLHIVSYIDFVKNHKIREIYSIKNVKRICGLWEKNWLICMMNDGSIQYYRNTFSKFKQNFFKEDESWKPKWVLIYPKDQQITTISNSGKTELLKSLEDWSISIDFDEDVVDESDKIDHSIIDKIWDIKISDKGESLRELFDAANDEESITLVWKVFQKIKNIPQIANVEWITKTIDKEILDKKNKIILNTIFSELWDIIEELWEDPDLATLVTIKDKLKTIQMKRWKIQVWHWYVTQDKELKSLIEITDQKITEYKELHKEELENEIQKNLERIKEILDNIEYAIDISSVYDTSFYKTTEDMISCLDKTWQEKFQKKLENLIQWRIKEIKENSNKAKKDEAEKIENKKRKAEEYINQIKEIIDEIDDIDKVEQLKDEDTLVQKTKKLFGELPSSEAQVLSLKLDKIFGERIFALRLSWEESKWVVQNLDTYWIDTILYYDEDWSEQVEWKIEWKEKSDWKISIVVKLMNWETHEYDKSLYLKEAQKYWWVRIKWKKIKFDMDSDEFDEFSLLLYEWQEEWQAKKYHELLRELRKLPLTGKDKENISEEKKKILEKIQNMRNKYGDVIYAEHLISRLIKQQKLNPRSKVPPFNPNYIVLDEEKEILKTLSTRLVDQKQNQQWIEILEWGPWLWKTVMCEFLAWVTNREIVRVQCSKMDPSDMFFSPTLKKWETSREPADWIKLMQKPWTIILFDEIDKLNDQCIERLHSLFDGGRSVYDPQLWKIKVNPDCLFLWTRNSYDRLSNPMLSRWRILQINYPSELNEAYKISKYSDNSVLKKLSYEDFQMLYDKYVTRWESAPNNANEKKIYDLVININHLLNVFSTLRKQYDSDEPFAFELSYRDARQIFVDYNISWDFKLAMENVLIPKARWAVIDPDDKKTQENMVRQAIDQEM